MHFNISFGLVAALASCAAAEQAYNYPQLAKRDFFGNQTTGTTSASSTVCKTVTETVTHCPKYAKHCPPESTETRTRTVPIGETTYPVVTTSSNTAHPTSPHGTGKHGHKVKPTETGDEEVTTTTISSTITRYITVTLTSGGHRLTSTIPVTDTKVRTHTITATHSATDEAEAESEPTTTITTTSTITSTRTVKAKPTGNESSPTGDESSPTGDESSPTGDDQDEESCEPVTVTETQKETVTVTVSPSKTATHGPIKSKSRYYHNPSAKPTNSGSTGLPYPTSTGEADPTGTKPHGGRYPPSYGRR